MGEVGASNRTVAVLGAGIMGSSVALFLARKNIRVLLFDAAPEPFTGASRWNEGKIHLGYLYGADPSLRTARQLLPGGLSFPGLVTELIGCDFPDDMVTSTDDRYLIHRDSVASPEDVLALAGRVSALCREHPEADRYLVPLRDTSPRPLTRAELDNEYNSDLIRAGFEVPERSVSTGRVADLFVEALKGTPTVEPIMRHRVLSVRATDRGRSGWAVDTVNAAGDPMRFERFDAVVNALWEGRNSVDASVGFAPPSSWTHRYRVSLFATTAQPDPVRSAVVAVGPFGDVKNFDGRNLYLSWYEAGLLVETNALEPPPAPRLDDAAALRIAQEKIDHLSTIIPSLEGFLTRVEAMQVRGGWVYAAGHGSLADRQSGLHRRDRIGPNARHGYYSIDTGKYSVAPLFAQQVADSVAAGLA